jgi:hypothetical protein
VPRSPVSPAQPPLRPRPFGHNPTRSPSAPGSTLNCPYSAIHAHSGPKDSHPPDPAWRGHGNAARRSPEVQIR